MIGRATEPLRALEDEWLVSKIITDFEPLNEDSLRPKTEVTQLQNGGSKKKGPPEVPKKNQQQNFTHFSITSRHPLDRLESVFHLQSCFLVKQINGGKKTEKCLTKVPNIFPNQVFQQLL